MTDREIARELWRVLSNIRRSAIDYTEQTTYANKIYLIDDIGKAYDVLQENGQNIFKEQSDD